MFILDPKAPFRPNKNRPEFLRSGFPIFGSRSKRFDNNQTRRSTIIFLISAMAFAGFKPFGQAWEQFMMVWHR